MTPTASLAERWNAVRERIADAARSVGRDPAAITLIAVSKTHPWADIAALSDLGQLDFGENRIEEAESKLKQSGADQLRWHMIGHVQTRKAPAVVQAGFALIHSVDTVRLAEKLSRLAADQGRRQAVLLECNVSGEASKAGFAGSVEPDWPELIDSWAALKALPGLDVRGLMTMAPWGTDDETARPVFDRLRRLADAARARLGVDWPWLSMGMTDDYVGAVREGATHVRVGRAILGERA